MISLKYAQILAFSLVLALTAVYPNKTMAQYYSQSEAKQSIVVDKQLRSMNDSKYFDNILASQKLFVDGDVIEFKIIVSNRGNTTLNNIGITDKLPNYLSMIFFPGNYDEKSGSVAWKIEKLNPGESKDYLIRAKVDGFDKVGIVTKKLINNASACSDTTICDNDNASYFVSKRKMPATGGSGIIVETVSLMILAGCGLAMRRLSRGY